MKVQALNAKEARKAEKGEPFISKCMWFAGCKHAAVTTVHHPVLGEVPVCEEHERFAKGE